MIGAVLDGKLGGPLLDRGAAALAALVAAIGVVLVPVELLQNLVVQTPLPELFPPADPPLGLKARIGFAVAAAVVAGAVVWLAMRLLQRASGLFEDAAEDAESPLETLPAPRVRRRDQHPDAPMRAPLSALRDLGEPDAAAFEPRRRRSVLADVPVDADEPTAAIAQRDKRMAVEPVAPAEPMPSFDAPAADRLGRIKRSHSAETPPEQATADELLLESALADGPPLPEEPLGLPPAFEASAFSPRGDAVVEAPAAAAAEPRATIAPAMPIVPGEMPTLQPEAVAEPAVTGRESIAELMARLERAIEQRRAPAQQGAGEWPIEGPPPVPAPREVPARETRPIVLPEPMDERLRSALESLKRFAPQRG